MHKIVQNILCSWRCCNNRERFELLVEILCHEDTRRYFPAYIKKKGGSPNGLLDYFFNGTPDVQFSKQVSDKYIPTEKWEQLTDFNEILDTYFKALQRLRDHNCCSIGAA